MRVPLFARLKVPCLCILFCTISAISWPLCAQPVFSPAGPCELRAPGQCGEEILGDQAAFLTSPFRLRAHDMAWLLPLGAGAGAAYAFDKKTLEHVSTDSSEVANFRRLSNFTGIYAPVAGVGAFWLVGKAEQDAHLREAGVVSGQALVDTMLLTEMLKFAANRVRPAADGFVPDSGKFWPNRKHYRGGDSFPSGHTAIAFAFARIAAGEFPGWKTSLAAYSLAGSTAVARVAGREHFPSDVIVGGAIGYLIGGYVDRHHAEFGVEREPFYPMAGSSSAGTLPGMIQVNW